MITLFNVGDTVDIITKSRIDQVAVFEDSKGNPVIKYAVDVNYLNGAGDYQWIREEDLLKMLENKETTE